MKKIILASGSPRRKELLEMLNVKFEVIPDNSPESIKENCEPDEIVCSLARDKCLNVSKKINYDAIVIAADTIVFVDGKLIGKPKDKDEAFEMLSNLSGKEHEVYTGVSIIDTMLGKNVLFFEKTKVKFKKLCDEEIIDYIKTGEPMDKAGAYGIQNLGALFVEKIDGDYFNVVGLPVCKLGEALKKEFGINIIDDFSLNKI